MDTQTKIRKIDQTLETINQLRIQALEQLQELVKQMFYEKVKQIQIGDNYALDKVNKEREEYLRVEEGKINKLANEKRFPLMEERLELTNTH